MNLSTIVMHYFLLNRLKTEAEQAEKLKSEVRQISSTAINLQHNLEEVSQARDETQTAYKVCAC